MNSPPSVSKVKKKTHRQRNRVMTREENRRWERDAAGPPQSSAYIFLCYPSGSEREKEKKKKGTCRETYWRREKVKDFVTTTGVIGANDSSLFQSVSAWMDLFPLDICHQRPDAAFGNALPLLSSTALLIKCLELQKRKHQITVDQELENSWQCL